MFDLLKMLFYTFVAVVVGVFIGTVPVGGKTIGERIAGLYQPVATKAAEPKPAVEKRAARAEAAKPAARAVPRAGRAPQREGVVAAKPISAGAANSPELHTSDDRAELDKIIARKSKAN